MFLVYGENLVRLGGRASLIYLSIYLSICLSVCLSPYVLFVGGERAICDCEIERQKHGCSVIMELELRLMMNIRCALD